MIDIAIIGAGPAGLCASIYAKRFNRSVAIFENDSPGGAMIKTEIIKNYPGFPEITGYELSKNMFDQVMNLGVEYIPEKVMKVEKTNQVFTIKTDTNEYSARSIIIATGTSNKTLGLKNEMKYFYKGISWCAICDGPLYKDKDVAVVGGGLSAISSALVLARQAKKVYLIHRREEFRGEKKDFEKLKSLENVIFITNANIIDFIGEKKLEGIKVLKKSSNKEEIISLNINCLFECVGKVPNSLEFRSLIDLDENDHIITNNEMKTSVEGIFACGDAIRKEVRQIATAINDGAIAAISADKYLR